MKPTVKGLGYGDSWLGVDSFDTPQLCDHGCINFFSPCLTVKWGNSSKTFPNPVIEKGQHSGLVVLELLNPLKLLRHLNEKSNAYCSTQLIDYSDAPFFSFKNFFCLKFFISKTVVKDTD